jgi:hypothetical protein
MKMAKVSTNDLGLLEPGIHLMTLDEVEELFGCFQRSDRRSKLMERLRKFVKAVRDASEQIQIFVDGSFIMSKVDEPGDIDVILVLPADWDATADLRPFEYNVISKRMVRKVYGFDMFIGTDGEAVIEQAINFFSQVNVKWRASLGIPAATVKGLVKVRQ